MTPDDAISEIAGNVDLMARISQEIAARGGSIPFARFMELALYHPEFGYYMSATRRPGRGGDFITAPEASPHFGHTLARQFAEFWERLGRPRQWSIREYGAGIGGLAYDVMAGLDSAEPASFDALTYHLAEINPSMRGEAGRSMHEAGLDGKVRLEDPAEDLPAIHGAILGNEVADAFPVHRVVRTNDPDPDRGWIERYVAVEGEAFGWQDGDISPGASAGIESLIATGIDVPPGGIVDISPAAAKWFRDAVARLSRGYAVLIDYGYPARELYQQHRLEGTLRGYRGHSVTDNPLIRVGDQDLTAHVDFSAMQRAGEASGLRLEGFTTQGAMLSSLDLGDAILDLQSDPATTTEEYLATQAVVLRLIDPAGLGRFGVLMMSKDLEQDSPLRAFRDPPPSF